MRHNSTIGRPVAHLFVVPPRTLGPVRYNNKNEELNAFRGFLLAATTSALLWGIGLAALWLMLKK